MSAPDKKDWRVLAIQSHVVHGYAGNKSATFPLQVLGFEVDPLNSVQFSTHTKYDNWSGQVLESKDLIQLFEGLKKDGIESKYTHVSTGYVSNESFLKAVGRVVENVKRANPDAIYFCDPVMGDKNQQGHGYLYVPENIIPVYREKIIKLADVLTPNQFEAELLTGVKITDESSAFEAIDQLHSSGVKTVIISSSDFGPDDKLICLASVSSIDDSKPRRWRLEINRLPVSLVGTGDLFAALILAWLTKSQGDMKLALEMTVGTLQDVIKRTYQHAMRQEGQLKNPENYELRLIQSKNDIEQPKTRVVAKEITI